MEARMNFLYILGWPLGYVMQWIYNLIPNYGWDIPITDFPEEEQDRLRAGIWFSSMMDVFHYLESYTS